MTSREESSRSTLPILCRHGNVRRWCGGCGWEEVLARNYWYWRHHDDQGREIGDRDGETGSADSIRGASG